MRPPRHDVKLWYPPQADLPPELFMSILPVRVIAATHPGAHRRGGDVATPPSSASTSRNSVPHRQLLPNSPADRAKARWLEEFADTRLGDVLIWRLCYQLIVRIASTRGPQVRVGIGYVIWGATQRAFGGTSH